MPSICRVLSQDILLGIFEFLDPVSYITLRAVHRSWFAMKNDSPSWKTFCEDLWRNKQNHPVERWVRVSPTPDSEEDIARNRIETLSLYLLLLSDPLPYDLERCVNSLQFIRLAARSREAAPISTLLREEQISLESQLTFCESDAERLSLSEQILKNINTPQIVTSLHLQFFEEQGKLLSWRESYIASIIDSFRCSITYNVKFIISPRHQLIITIRN